MSGPSESNLDCDYLVIGSGFGGSVSALRLAAKGYRVEVMEMGRRWTPANLPRTNWNYRRWLWRPLLGLRGFFNMRFFRHMVVLHGNAVGGGSITYANTLLVPPETVWGEGTWAAIDGLAASMPAHYATAQRMLGVTRNELLGPADHALKRMAEAAGVGDTWYPTDVGVFFGKPGDKPGTRYPDPYFGGEGPERGSCTGCGGCMMGCRFGAKNSLDQNYLWLAEKRGARVNAETKVIDVRPVGADDGGDGYSVTTVDSTWSGLAFGAGRRVWRARHVVFAASSLGTQELLFELRDRGSLPRISPALGKRVRTNAESLIGVRVPEGNVDFSTGIAIGSGVHIDRFTHIEATRYPKGSDAMGFLATALTDGKPGWTRILTWLNALTRLLVTHRTRALKFLQPFGYAAQTIIFLCMQTLDGHLDLEYRRRWWWPFGKAMVSTGKRIPTYIPAANDFARKGAAAIGGIPGSALTEILLDIPMTAHCMGGAGMAATAQEGVVDGQNRVFGYRGLYIVDGSMLGANLGVNPSLTITALAERAMSFIEPSSSVPPTRMPP